MTANNQPHTQHTTLPVPLVYAGPRQSLAPQWRLTGRYCPHHARPYGSSAASRNDWSIADFLMKITRPVVAICLSCYELSLSSLSVADDKQQARLEDLKRSITSLEKASGHPDKEKSNLQSDLKKVELEASQISRDLRKLRKNISGLESKFSRLNKQEDRLARKYCPAKRRYCRSDLRCL